MTWEKVGIEIEERMGKRYRKTENRINGINK